MQIRRHFAQGTPQDSQRKAPAGMPTSVPPAKPVIGRTPPRDTLPAQQPVTDDPTPKKPARWKHIVKRVLTVIGIILALAVVYLFLLIGEPGEDDQLLTQSTPQEETIRVPISGTEAEGNVNINELATRFGEPVLALYKSSLTLQKTTLFDTAFRGGYARRCVLQYTFADGQTLTVESIRPTAAVALLGSDGYSLNLNTLYTLAGMDAVRMDSTDATMLVSRGSGAAYAIICPAEHVTELGSLIKQATLAKEGV